MHGWIPLTIAIFLNAWIAADFIVKRDWPMMIVLTGYIISTIGLLWHSLKG